MKAVASSLSAAILVAAIATTPQLAAADGWASGTRMCATHYTVAARATGQGFGFTAKATVAGASKTILGFGTQSVYKYSESNHASWETSVFGGTYLGNDSYSFCQHV